MGLAEETSDSDIALVGMACRFPGANNVDALWRNLVLGRDSATTFTDEQLLAAGVDAAALRDSHYVKVGQVLDHVESFDAPFFGIPADEAEILDPQHRHFLECAVEALEHAGYDPARYGAAIGLFASASSNTYLLNNLLERYRAGSLSGHYRLMLANDKDFLPTRVSYKLDLRGPSIGVNTACSSSLVAVHLACLSLLSGECSMALAGAVHIHLPQPMGYHFQEGMILSPDGRCRAFDRNARGTIPGNGVGIVVLKRLSDALADRDTIHALIKGSAINNDGSGKAGYTAPSVTGQASVVTEALKVAGCSADDISYVEAHGTGTVLGDPVEVRALSEAFSKHTQRKGFCAIGSVKTNIGHLDTGSGVAGLIKTCLMLQNERLVPSLHFETPNPEIDFANSPFFVNTEARVWPRQAKPRRAGVSSFGIGGTNAHVIVQEAPGMPARASADGPQLLLISARSAAALQKATSNLGQHLGRHPELALRDVALTLALGRRPHAHRQAIVCRTTKDAALALALADQQRLLSGLAIDQAPGVTLILGAAPESLEQDLAALSVELPAFAQVLGECSAELELAAPESLATLASPERVFLASYALGRFYERLGVQLRAVVGVGSAQLAAACLVGMWSPIDALVFLRSRGRGTPSLLPAPEGRVLLSNVTGQRYESGDGLNPGLWANEPSADGLLQILANRPSESQWPWLQAFSQSGAAGALENLGRAWTRGEQLDWAALHGESGARRVPLPTYPFERQRYWVDAGGRSHAAPSRSEPMLSERVARAPEAERMPLLLDVLRAAVLGVLGPEAKPPDPDKSLYELGIDSLMLIDMAEKLSKEWGHPIAASSFVEYPNMRAFAAHLLGTLGFAVAAPASQDEGRTSRRAAMRAAR